MPVSPPIVQPLISAATRSFGDTTASRNGSGPYYRDRVTPTNDRTPAQVFARAQFTELMRVWREELSAGTRDGWNVYAANVRMPARLGKRQRITGRDHFLRVNLSRYRGRLPMIRDAPLVFNLGWYLPFAVIAIAGTRSAQLTWAGQQPTLGDLDSRLFIFTGPDWPPSIRSFKPPLRFRRPWSAGYPPPVPFQLLTIPTAGNRIFFRILVQQSDGRTAKPFVGSTIVNVP